jgi:hypothetical protein
VVPWEAPNGAVEYLVGRTIGEPREGAKRYMGLQGRRTRWPWGCADLHELVGPDTAVAVVEGAIDAVSFNALCARHGVDCIAVAIPGADTWRDTQALPSQNWALGASELSGYFLTKAEKA